MNALTKLSHAYIADETSTQTLSLAAVCSSAGIAQVPCRQCKDCDKALRGIHPDIITVESPKDKKSIAVDQIRALKRDVYIAPNEAARKVYILANAHTMNENAQNAFLLMLEEPPAHVVFILQTSSGQVLLPTVRSRCVTINPAPPAGTPDTPESTAADPDMLPLLISLANDYTAALDDNMSLTRCMFRLDKLDRQGFAVFITLARERLSRRLREDSSGRDKSLEALKLLGEAADMLERNISAGHISGMLCANLINI